MTTVHPMRDTRRSIQKLASNMKKVLSATQVVSNFRVLGCPLEICATAEVSFDTSASHLQIELDSFIRPAGPESNGDYFDTGWLPQKQSLTQPVSVEQAPDLTLHVLHRWAQTVHDSIPGSLRKLTWQQTQSRPHIALT
jgi:hypothetical protein